MVEPQPYQSTPQDPAAALLGATDLAHLLDAVENAVARDLGQIVVDVLRAWEDQLSLRHFNDLAHILGQTQDPGLLEWKWIAQVATGAATSDIFKAQSLAEHSPRHAWLAAAMDTQGSQENTVEFAARALEQGASFVDQNQAALLLAQYLANRGCWNDAITYLERVAFHPHETPQYAVGWLHPMRQWIEAQLRWAEYECMLGLTEETRPRLIDAIEHFDSVKPDARASLSLRAARCYRMLGDLRESQRLLESAHEQLSHLELPITAAVVEEHRSLQLEMGSYFTHYPKSHDALGKTALWLYIGHVDSNVRDELPLRAEEAIYDGRPASETDLSQTQSRDGQRALVSMLRKYARTGTPLPPALEQNVMRPGPWTEHRLRMFLLVAEQHLVEGDTLNAIREIKRGINMATTTGFVMLRAEMQLLLIDAYRMTNAWEACEKEAMRLSESAAQIGSPRYASEAEFALVTARNRLHPSWLRRFVEGPAPSPVAKRRAQALLGESPPLDELDRIVVQSIERKWRSDEQFHIQEDASSSTQHEVSVT